MEKFHDVIIFSLHIANRKNYNDMIENNRHLPTNQLEQDHNADRIMVA